MKGALFDLTGRTALVTGSSRGLGRAMAEGLAEAGAAVVLNGADAGRLADAAAAMRDAGHTVHEARFDVTDEAAIIGAFADLDAKGIEIDILINNAGIQFRRPMVELETADWRRVIETNLTSAFVIGREAAKRMIPRGRGKIINIGSLTSEAARATVAPYTVAKGGIKMLTRAMTAEWAAHGIQANAIGPGYMLTEMNTALVENEAFNAWVVGRDTVPPLGQARGADRHRRVPRLLCLGLCQRPDHLRRWRNARRALTLPRSTASQQRIEIQEEEPTMTNYQSPQDPGCRPWCRCLDNRRPGADRARQSGDDAEDLDVVSQRSAVFDRPHLVRPVRAEAEGGDGRSGHDAILPRQPIGTGSRRREPAQGRGRRPHAGRHVDLDQRRAGIRRVRSRLRLPGLRPHAARVADAGGSRLAGAARAESRSAFPGVRAQSRLAQFHHQVQVRRPRRPCRAQDPLPAEPGGDRDGSPHGCGRDADGVRRDLHRASGGRHRRDGARRADHPLGEILRDGEVLHPDAPHPHPVRRLHQRPLAATPAGHPARRPPEGGARGDGRAVPEGGADRNRRDRGVEDEGRHRRRLRPQRVPRPRQPDVGPLRAGDARTPSPCSTRSVRPRRLDGRSPRPRAAPGTGCGGSGAPGPASARCRRDPGRYLADRRPPGGGRLRPRALPVLGAARMERRRRAHAAARRHLPRRRGGAGARRECRRGVLRRASREAPASAGRCDGRPRHPARHHRALLVQRGAAAQHVGADRGRRRAAGAVLRADVLCRSGDDCVRAG